MRYSPLLLFACLCTMCTVVAALSYYSNGKRTGLIFVPAPVAGWNVKHSTQVRPKRPRSLKLKYATDWNPPEYVRAMNDYEDAVYAIRNFFALNDARMDINVIAILYTVAVLSMHVADDGWKFYDSYPILAKVLASSAKADPEKAVNTINCYLSAADTEIERLKMLMTNEWMQLFCGVNPEGCDSGIHVIVKMSNGVRLLREADILLTLGRAGAKYKQLEGDIVEWAQEYMPVQNLTSPLRPLVAASSVAHKLIFRGEDECYHKTIGLK